LKPEMLSRWKAQFLERAATVFEREDQNNPALVRVAELERLVGRLTLELEVSKKASSLLEVHLSRGVK
jgi:transposase